MRVTQRIAAWSLTLLLAACGGGYEGTPPTIDASAQPLKIVGATSITLVPTEMGRIEITGGTRPYAATSSNTAVALASISDNMLSVAAVGGDLTPISVSITDAKNARAALSVTVTNSPQQGAFTLSERVFSILPGASKVVAIFGGTGPYTAASTTPRVASASVSGTSVTVKGESEGVNAEIKVFDSKGVTQTALVSVAAPMPSASGLDLFSNMPTNLSLRPNNSVTYTLGGGTPPYSVRSSNEAVLTARVRGAALMLQPGTAGNATVTVTDSVNQTRSQRIYVMTTSAPLTLSTSAISADIGSSITVGIAGGMPPYSAVTTATTLIGSGLVVDGDQLTVTLQAVGGPGVVTVKDSEGATAKLDVTGTALLSNLSVSPRELTIAESQLATFPIRVVQGRAPYSVFTSHPSLLVPAVIGNTISVSTPNMPCVDVDTNVVITVIDASNASAATTVRIVDAGACPISTAPRPSDIQLAPGNTRISELLAVDAAGQLRQTSLSVAIVGGVAPFTTFSSHPLLLNPTVSGNSLLISSLGTSTAPVEPCVAADTPVVITVVDATGGSATTTVTIADNGECPARNPIRPSFITLSPDVIRISELLPLSIPIAIVGGTEPFTAYSSNPLLLTATLAGRNMSVVTGPIGSLAPVAPCVGADTAVVMTVIDNAGGFATTVVTITDNGACPR